MITKISKEWLSDSNKMMNKEIEKILLPFDNAASHCGI